MGPGDNVSFIGTDEIVIFVSCNGIRGFTNVFHSTSLFLHQFKLSKVIISNKHNIGFLIWKFECFYIKPPDFFHSERQTQNVLVIQPFFWSKFFFNINRSSSSTTYRGAFHLAVRISCAHCLGVFTGMCLLLLSTTECMLSSLIWLRPLTKKICSISIFFLVLAPTIVRKQYHFNTISAKSLQISVDARCNLIRSPLPFCLWPDVTKSLSMSIIINCQIECIKFLFVVQAWLSAWGVGRTSSRSNTTAATVWLSPITVFTSFFSFLLSSFNWRWLWYSASVLCCCCFLFKVFRGK